MEKSFEKFYTEEEALEEASKMKEKIESSEVNGYTEAERQVELEKKLLERFGEIKISDELKQQILPYVDSEKLIIGSEDLAAVVTERSERGAGIGYWDQVRVFLGDQNAMQEWNWRHKDNQKLDRKHLSVQSIENIKASKSGDQVIVTVELLNNAGNRNVNFEFTVDNIKLPFEDGEIPIQIAKPIEEYARKEIDEKIEYAYGIDEIQEIAKTSGIELTEDDFRKVVENILNVGLPSYVEKAQQVAKMGGFKLTKDDYKNFVASHNRVEFLDADGKLHGHYDHTYDWKIVRPIDIVAPIANFSKKDYEEIVEKFIEQSKLSSGYFHEDRLREVEKIAEYGKEHDKLDLDKEIFHKIANAYIDSLGHNNKALEMSKVYGFEFTKDEYKKLVGGFLSEAKEGLKNHAYSLKQAQEVAEAGKIEITKEDYKKFLDDSIKEMFSYEKKPATFRNYPEDKLNEIQEIADIAGINLNEKEESLPKWLKDVQNQDLEEAEKTYSLKPEMRSAESRTGYKPYEKPEITESVVDEIKGYGAFVFKEQIDHDTRFPQMRYTLYFVDKTGNKKEIFEKHDYIDDGGGGSIYVENNPSITEVEISDQKIKFKVGGETHEIAI